MPTIETLEAQLKTALTATEAYSDAITEKYREQLPVPVDANGKTLPAPDALLVERAHAWTAEERAELDRLRTVARDLAVQLHRARQTATSDGTAT